MSDLVPKLALDEHPEIVVVFKGDHKGVYIEKGKLLSPQAQVRLVEMIVGRNAVLAAQAQNTNWAEPCRSLPTNLIPATDELWAFAIGLVVVKMAERMKL